MFRILCLALVCVMPFAHAEYVDPNKTILKIFEELPPMNSDFRKFEQRGEMLIMRRDLVDILKNSKVSDILTGVVNDLRLCREIRESGGLAVGDVHFDAKVAALRHCSQLLKSSSHQNR